MKKENLHKEKIFTFSLHENPAYDRAGINSVRAERISLKIDTVVRHRSDGRTKEAVDQDQARQAVISHVIRRVVNSSEVRLSVINPSKNEATVEAFQLLELSNEVHLYSLPQIHNIWSRLLLLRTYSCFCQPESRC